MTAVAAVTAAATADRRPRSLQKSSSSLPGIGPMLPDEQPLSSRSASQQPPDERRTAATGEMAASADQTGAERVAQRVGHGRITVELSATVRPSMSPQCALGCISKQSGIEASNPDRRASAATAEKDDEETSESHPAHLSVQRPG